MADDASERHNRLATEFVQSVGRGTRTDSEMMVVMESVMLGAMHLLVNLHGVQPAHASILMEAALQHATERFAGQPHV